MKTICQLVHTLNLGGAEVLAHRLATDPWLSEQYRFVFFCLDASEISGAGVMANSLIQEGFAVECLNRQPGLDRACMKKMASLFDKYQVDVVHAHQCTPYFYAAAARWTRKNPPILLTEHGRFFPDVVSWKRRLINRFFWRESDILTAVGRAVADALAEKEGFPRDKIQVIYNGVNPDDFDNLKSADENDTRESVRREFGIADDAFVLIQVARLDSIKDHATALNTINVLRNDFPDVRLIIVGDGPERGVIEQKIQEDNLSHQVVLTGARQDISRLIKGADLFLLTSLSEGIPVTFLEAMAARLPIVSTNAGGCREVVEHQKTGYLEPIQDPVSLAAAVKALIINKSLRIKFGENGRLRCEEFFTQRAMHDAYRKLYESILLK